MKTLLEQAENHGALGVALSGAGPTMLALVDARSGQKAELEAFLKDTLAKEGIEAQTLWLKPSGEGVAAILLQEGDGDLLILRGRGGSCMKRVAILGPSTFSEEATRHFLGEDFTYVSYKLISEVFNATASGETELGVIPIENTLEGSVHLHVDWLVHEVDLPIRAEWVFPIDMNLIGYPNPDGQT